MDERRRDCGKNHRLRQPGLGWTSIRYRKNNNSKKNRLLISGKNQEGRSCTFTLDFSQSLFPFLRLDLMVGFFHTRALVMSL